jgi:hypothetical protein
MVGAQGADESARGVALEHSGHIGRAVVVEGLVVPGVRGAFDVAEVNELDLASLGELRAI